MMDSYIITKLFAQVISRKQKMSLVGEKLTGFKADGLALLDFFSR